MIIENTTLRITFIAYLYSLIHNPARDKYIFEDKDIFNKREYAVYSVLKSMIVSDELIDKASLYYNMQKSGVLSDYNFVITSGAENNFTVDRIETYYNIILKEFKIALLKSCKTEKDISDAIIRLENMQEKSETQFITTTEALDDLTNETQGIELLKTQLEVFDEKIFLSHGALCLAGTSGSGKTTLLTELIKRILVCNRNKKISIQWNSMEDDISMLIASFISKDVNIPAKILTRKNSKLKSNTQFAILENVFKSFDIEFQDKQLSMHEIKQNWITFMKQRKKLKSDFCILIIDNVMQLKDNTLISGSQNEKDDYICQMIGQCRDEGKKHFKNNYLVIYLHHLNKEQLSRVNAKNCYIPIKGDVKGSGRYLDIATTTLLIHRFFDFKDIMIDFKAYEKYLEHLTMIISIKNRSGGYIGQERIWLDMTYKYAMNY